MRTKVAVPGFVGNLMIEYGLLGGGTAYDVDKALYVRLYGYLWTWYAASGTGPWDKCVMAPSGSTRWCLKVPFKATTGKVADWSIESECLALQSDDATDNVGYFTFGATSSKRVFSASDGYIYVEMYDEKPPNAPVTLFFDTTLPVMRA